MTDCKNYIKREFIRLYTCIECNKSFHIYESAKRHIVEKHGISVKFNKCIRCGEPYIEIIEGQMVCAKKECFLSEEGKKE